MFSGILYTLVGIIEGLVGLRLLLRLLGANPESPVVSWIYSWSTPLVAPFAGVFGQNATVAGPGVVAQSVFDWSALVALLFYGVIAAILGSALMHRSSRV